MTDAIITTVLAGIAYDPEIRGVLIFAFSLVFFCGSGWLLLGTNMGSRLGFLVAAGGALRLADGAQPLVVDLRRGRHRRPARVERRGGQRRRHQPGPAGGGPHPPAREPARPRADPGRQPRDRRGVRRGRGPHPQRDRGRGRPAAGGRDQLEDLEGDWAVLPQTAIGDAQSAADAALISDETGLFTATSEYVLVGGFEAGGKPDRESDSIVRPGEQPDHQHHAGAQPAPLRRDPGPDLRGHLRAPRATPRCRRPRTPTSRWCR